MKNYIVRSISLLLFFSFFFIKTGISQVNDFPQDWFGKYKGDLEIFTQKGLAQTVPMELHLLATSDSSRFTWNLIYGDSTNQELRPYELVAIDTLPNTFILDEKNGIAMEGYFVGEQFIQRFEVMNNLLMTTLKKQADGSLYWEIMSGKLEPIRTSGDIPEEEIPPVNAYPIGNVQRAVLKKF